MNHDQINLNENDNNNNNSNQNTFDTEESNRKSWSDPETTALLRIARDLKEAQQKNPRNAPYYDNFWLGVSIKLNAEYFERNPKMFLERTPDECNKKHYYETNTKLYTELKRKNALQNEQVVSDGNNLNVNLSKKRQKTQGYINTTDLFAILYGENSKTNQNINHQREKQISTNTSSAVFDDKNNTRSKRSTVPVVQFRKYWTKDEKKALLQIVDRITQEERPRTGKHKSIWPDVSQELTAKGFPRTALQCELKHPKVIKQRNKFQEKRQKILGKTVFYNQPSNGEQKIHENQAPDSPLISNDKNYIHSYQETSTDDALHEIFKDANPDDLLAIVNDDKNNISNQETDTNDHLQKIIQTMSPNSLQEIFSVEDNSSTQETNQCEQDDDFNQTYQL